MALDVYFKEDIRHILCAADYANTKLPLPERNPTNIDYDTGFREGHDTGYRKALEVVGLAFGIVAVDREGRFVVRE